MVETCAFSRCKSEKSSSFFPDPDQENSPSVVPRSCFFAVWRGRGGNDIVLSVLASGGPLGLIIATSSPVLRSPGRCACVRPMGPSSKPCRRNLNPVPEAHTVPQKLWVVPLRATRNERNALREPCAGLQMPIDTPSHPVYHHACPRQSHHGRAPPYALCESHPG